MNIKNENYELIENRRIEDLHSDACLLRHKKSGARIALLSNDDENKVFYIGFRTTPHDSTGVAHIMEHTVLCGSRKYPVKDPFVELAKGSLNTFLNAMTYPDKTVYPVASCNDKDFKNLMDVYLDAVFYPNIYKEKKIFMQEGWHYELSKDGPLTYNGVVYNEMKGAFSSPDDVLSRSILNSLYPDNTYAFESGGDPDDIPDLTYEDYLDFHRTFYHPSNSMIYLYGNMDMEERLDYLDKEYLSAFDVINVDSAIGFQKPFDKSLDIVKEYPITSEDSEENNTYLSYNVAIGDVLDREKYIAFQILDDALSGTPGAPLKKALIEAGIGTEIMSIYDNGVLQPYYSIAAKNADLSQKEEFISIIENELKRLVKEGIEKNALKSSLNIQEFKYREADFGMYPKGLMYGLNMLDSWNYDEKRPFIHIERNETYRSLREKIDTDYFEKLIEEFILNNPHKAIVSVVPKKGLQNERDEALAAKLSEKLDSLSEEEKERIIKETADLKAYQEEEDSPEALKCLPRLTRDDIKKEAEPFINEAIEKGGIKYLFHDIETNGVSYIKLLFPIDCIDEKGIFALNILSGVVGLMDTDEHDYASLFYEVGLRTGGIVPGLALFTSYTDNKDVKFYFSLRGKTFFKDEENVFDLAREMILGTKLDDKKRLLEILKEKKSTIEADMMSGGHSTAELRLASEFLKNAFIEENMHGISFYRSLCKIIDNYDEKADELISEMEDLRKKIFTKDKLFIDYTGSKERLESIEKYAEGFKDKLNESAYEKMEINFTPYKSNEAFMTSGQVQFVCRGGNYRDKGLKYNGALFLLRTILSYGYLWNNVRVKGGAYGCMNGFTLDGECYFVSYRDPKLKETIEIFDNVKEYIKSFDASEEEMTKYLIGAISSKDRPLTPSIKGSRSLGAYVTGKTYEDEQRERDELINADAKAIRDLYVFAEAALNDNRLCVIGNEKMVKENSELFDLTEMLI